MGAGTILLIALAVLITVIMYKVADGVHGTPDDASVAGRAVDGGGEPPLAGAKPDDVDEDAASGRGAHRGRHGCC